MGPNDQYPYNYYAGSNSAYPNHQQSHNQARTQTQQSSAQQWHTTGMTGDGSHGAAEALSQMGNHGPQISNTTMAAQYNTSGVTTGGFAAQSNESCVHSNTTTTATAPDYRPAVIQNQAHSNYATTTNYGTTQSQVHSHSHGQQQQQLRPSSVNSVRSARVALQRSPAPQIAHARPTSGHSQQNYQQQRVVHMADEANGLRAASPAQIQGSRNLQSLQQADHRAVNASADNATNNSTHNINQNAQGSPSNQYTYGHTNVTYGVQQQIGSQYDQSTTVDPTAVYDPWPEYERSLEASRKVKEAQQAKEAAEKAAQAADDQRRADEEKTREELDKAKEDKGKAVRNAVEDRFKEVKRKTDSERRDKSKQNTKGKTVLPTTPATSIEQNNGPAPDAGLDIAHMLNGAAESENPEAQIKALMAMVKAMNDKHPSLLAKIWEQERQEHLQKTTTQSPAAITSREVSQPVATPSAPTTTTSNGSTTKPSTKGSVAKAKATPTTRPSPPKQPTVNQLPTGTPPSAQPQQPVQNAQQPTQKPVQGGTVWPKEKKGQLAASAAAWLNAVPENRNNPIQPARIGEILDQNPTYIELCERVEAAGLKVERAAFARALLSVVPEASKTPSSAPAPTASKPPTNPPINGAMASVLSAQPPANGSRETPPTAAIVQPQVAQFESPYFDPNDHPIPLPIKTTPAASIMEGKLKSTEPKKSTSVPSEPASKKEAARKRNFADIVDLTALSEDDDSAPPPSKLQRYEYSAPPPVTVPNQAYQSSPNYLQGFQGIVPPYLQQQQQQQHQDYYANRPQPPPRAVDEKLKNLEMAKGIRREKALRRSGYDIKTIARDVLLATGKHPDMLPLNGHLELLRLAFPGQINFSTDLETIRWDLIDPGEPIPATSRLSPFTDDDDQDSVLDDADDESENEHRRARVQAPVDRSVVGWDGSVSVIQQVHPGTMGFSKGGVPGGVLKRRPGRPRKDRMSAPSGFQSRPQLGLNEEQRSSSGQPQQSNQRPSNTLSNTYQATSAISASQSTPSNRAPHTTPNSAPTAPGYSAFVRTGEDGKPAKKRGRPVGWRKSLHQKGVGVYAGGSGTPTDMPSKSSGLRKAVSSMPKAPDVKYAVYKCKWKDCKAELHNLETLTKHLNKLHGKVDEKGRFTCKWMDCAKNVQTVDQTTGAVKTVQQYHYFPDFTLWAKHVKEAHVNPVAWKLGDGPPGGMSDSNITDSEAYLSDARGHRVTPRIAAPEFSYATPSGPALAQRGRPPKKTPEQTAKEEQAKAEKRKKAIGPGMDKGGSTLANEKRRAGFVDDEEDEVIVDDE